MAITNTALLTPMTRDDMTLTPISSVGFAVGNVIRIDNEWMVQTGPAVGPANNAVIPVRRGGQGGTLQVAHPLLAPVAVSLASDVPNSTPGAVTYPVIPGKVIVSYSTDGAIAPPSVDTIIFLNKTTAGAFTLTAPVGVADGTIVTIYSNTAAAHVITYLAGFHNDTTASDIATFAATVGNSMTMMASRGSWGLLGTSGVTIA